MKRITYLSLLVALFPFALNAQNADSIRAEGFMQSAVACLKRGQPDSAGEFHRQALSIYTTNRNRIAWLKSHVRLAYVWAGEVNKPFVAIDLIESGLQQVPRPFETKTEWEQLALTYMAKAYLYEEYSGDFVSSKREYEYAFQVFLHQLQKHSDRVASYLYYKYGNICTRLGDYERARNLLQGGIDYAKQYNLPDIAKYGDLVIVLLELNKNTEAIATVQEGLQHSGTLAEPLITLRRCEARAYLNLGNIAAARQAAAFIPKLIKHLKNETDEDYYWSGYYEIQAEIEDASGNYTAAAANHKRAIQYETQTWGTPIRREVGKIYWALGDLQLRNGKHALALAQFQQALQCVLPGFRPAGVNDNPDASLFYEENTILECLEGKAKAFLALQQLEKALECYELIPIVEAKLRATHAYESSSLLALDESRRRFDEAVGIAWQLYERSIGNRLYADRAFRLTEQARGMLLLQSLSEAQAKYQLPEDVRQRENDLSIKITWYELQEAAEKEAGENMDAARLTQLQKELFDLKQENEKFKKELRERFPEYASLSDEIRFLVSGEVPSLLRSGMAMLDYYLTETSVFIFSFDAKGSFSWRKETLPAAFRESVGYFIDYLQNDDSQKNERADQDFRDMAHALYQLLLAPELTRMMPDSGSLIIIPDDALVFLPFEVLLRKPVAKGNWPNMPWLLEDHSIGYAYSATLLQMQHNISRKHREQDEQLQYAYGGFAPSYAESGNYDLKSTKPLVNNVRKLLGGKTWCGAEASEAQFKNVAPQCRVLLLAMHGLADAEHPELSQLLFGEPGNSNDVNDNVLYANELQIMQLQADLAVLSACHSGFGQLRKGEGMFSLARAFARAGVPATVMSLWLLHENTATPLVESFLKYMQQGQSKDEALRLAKLDFLHDDANFSISHPFYWAGVITSGDMCALNLKKENSFPWWWLASGAFVLGAGSWYFLRYRKVLAGRKFEMVSAG